MSDFALVIGIIGALVVAGVLAVILEWRGFYQREGGRVTISEYIYAGLGRSRPVIAWASFVAGAAFVHFISGG